MQTAGTNDQIARLDLEESGVWLCIPGYVTINMAH